MSLCEGSPPEATAALCPQASVCSPSRRRAASGICRSARFNANCYSFRDAGKKRTSSTAVILDHCGLLAPAPHYYNRNIFSRVGDPTVTRDRHDLFRRTPMERQMQFDKRKSDYVIVAAARPKRRHTGEPFQLPCRPRLNKNCDSSRLETRSASLPLDAAPTRPSFIEGLSSLAVTIAVAVLEGYALYGSAMGPGLFQPPGAATDLEDSDNL